MVSSIKKSLKNQIIMRNCAILILKCFQRLNICFNFKDFFFLSNIFSWYTVIFRKLIWLFVIFLDSIGVFQWWVMNVAYSYSHRYHVHIQFIQYIKDFDSDYDTRFCFNWKSVNSFFGNLNRWISHTGWEH